MEVVQCVKVLEEAKLQWKAEVHQWEAQTTPRDFASKTLKLTTTGFTME